MGKKLSEMSLEELWQLFPIRLSEHQPHWVNWYAEEAAVLEKILPQSVCRISHIGSTAIPGIWAKPIIDILVEAAPDCTLENLKEIITENGYLCMHTGENRVSFNKGYTTQGFAEKVLHLHLRYAGDNDELYFRDYLCENPETAKEYEQLKLRLWKEYAHNRDAYTNAKTAFVSEYTQEAKARYGNRYDF